MPNSLRGRAEAAAERRPFGQSPSVPGRSQRQRNTVLLNACACPLTRNESTVTTRGAEEHIRYAAHRPPNRQPSARASLDVEPGSPTHADSHLRFVRTPGDASRPESRCALRRDPSTNLSCAAEWGPSHSCCSRVSITGRYRRATRGSTSAPTPHADPRDYPEVRLTTSVRPSSPRCDHGSHADEPRMIPAVNSQTAIPSRKIAFTSHRNRSCRQVAGRCAPVCRNLIRRGRA